MSTRNIYSSDAIAITCKGMCLGSELEIQIMIDFFVTKHVPIIIKVFVEKLKTMKLGMHLKA
jgi:hypothetical protein